MRNMSNEKIKSVVVVTRQGVSGHYVGENIVHEINEEDIHIQGDPFMHYIGRNISGRVLFKISGFAPVEVIYFPTDSPTTIVK